MVESYKTIYEGFDTDIKFELFDPHIFGDTYDENIIRLLCVLSKGKDIFEIGTYRGRTTHNLALNANQVVTFDLGENTSNDGYSNYNVGEIYKKYSHTNVTQLIGNSLKFDFSPYYNRFDVVFLDGGHSYEVAKNDFKVSLKLIKDGGYIVVDDASWEGVNKAITELQSKYPIIHIKDIFFYKK
jgi:predicted O-methyltransferase YrrM